MCVYVCVYMYIYVFINIYVYMYVYITRRLRRYGITRGCRRRPIKVPSNSLIHELPLYVYTNMYMLCIYRYMLYMQIVCPPTEVPANSRIHELPLYVYKSIYMYMLYIHLLCSGSPETHLLKYELMCCVSTYKLG